MYKTTKMFKYFVLIDGMAHIKKLERICMDCVVFQCFVTNTPL